MAVCYCCKYQFYQFLVPGLSRKIRWPRTFDSRQYYFFFIIDDVTIFKLSLMLWAI